MMTMAKDVEQSVLADALRLAQAIVMVVAPTTVTVFAVVTAGLIANQSTRVNHYGGCASEVKPRSLTNNFLGALQRNTSSVIIVCAVYE